MNLVLALALGAALQEPNCREPQTQMDMNICAGESFSRADRELNRIWPQTQ